MWALLSLARPIETYIEKWVRAERILNKYLLAALPAIALLLVLAAHASAATITASNPSDLSYIIYYKNASINIAAENNLIKITNTDVNHSALVVFSPAFSVIVDSVNGAEIALVNLTDYSIVKTVDATTAGYGGSSVSPSFALALIIPANSTATLSAVYYTASKDVTALNAPTPPDGYKLVGDKTGSGDTEFTWTPSKKGSLWVAFWSESNTAVLTVYYKRSGDKWPVIHLVANPSKFVTDTEDVGGTYTLHFNISGTSGGEWEVLWAYKAEEDSKPAAPLPVDDHNDNNNNTVSIDKKKLEYAAAGLAFIVILFMAMSLTGHRRRW